MKNGMIVYEGGTKVWYKDDKKYRLEGPVVIFGKSGKKGWALNGKLISGKEHPFNIFRTEYDLPEDYEEWSLDMKILFKMTYGGNNV